MLFTNQKSIIFDELSFFLNKIVKKILIIMTEKNSKIYLSTNRRGHPPDRRNEITPCNIIE